MKTCMRCNKKTSLWDRDMISGVCSECRVTEDTKLRAKQKLLKVHDENAKTAIQPNPEQMDEPINGLLLVGFSLCAALFGGMLIVASSYGGIVFGYILLGVGGMLYMAGVIRWAVSGSQFHHFSHIHRKNLEIIELLETIADHGQHSEDLELIRRLLESGQITKSEYLKQRRKLLQGPSE